MVCCSEFSSFQYLLDLTNLLFNIDPFSYPSVGYMCSQYGLEEIYNSNSRIKLYSLFWDHLILVVLYLLFFPSCLVFNKIIGTSIIPVSVVQCFNNLLVYSVGSSLEFFVPVECYEWKVVICRRVFIFLVLIYVGEVSLEYFVSYVTFEKFINRMKRLSNVIVIK